MQVLETALQGPPGPRGLTGASGNAQFTPVGSLPLSGHSIVAVGSDGNLVAASSANASHIGRIAGLVTDAYAAGSAAEVQRVGAVDHAGWAWTPGLPLLLATNGQMAHALPPGAVFSQTVGVALSATRIYLFLQPPISIT